MDKWLVKKGSDGLTYLMNLNWNGKSKGEDHAMEHLSCFVPAYVKHYPLLFVFSIFLHHSGIIIFDNSADFVFLDYIGG
mgnify:CR=1 FL=1